MTFQSIRAFVTAVSQLFMIETTETLNDNHGNAKLKIQVSPLLLKLSYNIACLRALAFSTVSVDHCSAISVALK